MKLKNLVATVGLGLSLLPVQTTTAGDLRRAGEILRERIIERTPDTIIDLGVDAIRRNEDNKDNQELQRREHQHQDNMYNRQNQQNQGQSLPEGVVRNSNNSYSKAPGCAWINPNDPNSLETRCIPGYQHVRRGIINGEERLIADNGWVFLENGNPWAGVRHVPENIVKIPNSNGGLDYVPKRGYEFIDPNDFWTGVREIRRELIVIKYADLNGNGEIEHSEIFKIEDSDPINLDKWRIGIRYKSPDEDTPVNYTSYNPDGNKIGQSEHPQKDWRHTAQGVNEGDYLDAISGASLKQQGKYIITANQGSNLDSLELFLTRDYHARANEPSYEQVMDQLRKE